jgi:transcriptional regulator with XRE-family HTH domain
MSKRAKREKRDVVRQLRDAIRGSGRTLNELGRAAKVSPGQLSRFLKEERDITLEVAGRLCGVLGLHLVNEKGDEPPTGPFPTMKPGRPKRVEGQTPPAEGQPSAQAQGRKGKGKPRGKKP